MTVAMTHLSQETEMCAKRRAAARRFRIAVTVILIASFVMPNVALAQGGCKPQEQMKKIFEKVKEKKLGYQWDHLDKFRKPSLDDDYQNNVPEENMQQQMGPPSDTFQDSWPNLQGIITLILNLLKGILKKQGGHGVGIPDVKDVIGDTKDEMDDECSPEAKPWADWRKTFKTPGVNGGG